MDASCIDMAASLKASFAIQFMINISHRVIALIFIIQAMVAIAHNCPNCGHLLQEQACKEPLHYCPKCDKQFKNSELPITECMVCCENDIELLAFPCCQYQSCLSCAQQIVFTQSYCPQCRYLFNHNSSPVLRVHCPVPHCNYASAQSLALNEHLLVHESELFLAGPVLVSRHLRQGMSVICTVCSQGIACASTMELRAAAISEHLQAYHQQFTCLHCQRPARFEGREALLAHIVSDHCTSSCCFPNCDAPLTELQLYEHIDDYHGNYYSFCQALESGQLNVAGVDIQDDDCNDCLLDSGDYQEEPQEDQPAGGCQVLSTEESGEGAICTDSSELIIHGGCMIFKTKNDTDGGLPF